MINSLVFRKGHATNHAIITLVDKVARALDTGKIVVGVYLDLRKAFDTVPHTIPLDKLHRMGIRGNLLCLIKNYLEDRAQFVNFNDHSSRTQLITIGVPQGSILGPLFFISFIKRFFKIFSTAIFHTLRGRHNSAPRRKRV